MEASKDTAIPQAATAIKPPPATGGNYAPEFAISALVGYAAFEDGSAVAVRVLADGDVPLTLVVPTAMVEGFVSALRQAKQAAIAKMPQPDNNRLIFTPKTYHTMMTDDFPGVLMVYDKDTPTELFIGLDHVAARNMGHALKKQAAQVAARPRLIRIG